MIKDEWPLPWRAQRFGAAEMLAPTAPGESGPYRALRDAGAVIVGVGNMHELGAEQHRQRLRLRPGPQPLGHRALPRRLLERARRRGRRAARRRRGRRRRDRLDPLPGRLLRPDRAEADLRPLGDGRPPRGVVARRAEIRRQRTGAGDGGHSGRLRHYRQLAPAWAVPGRDLRALPRSDLPGPGARRAPVRGLPPCPRHAQAQAA